jgi:hypothetical protein
MDLPVDDGDATFSDRTMSCFRRTRQIWTTLYWLIGVAAEG